MEKRAANRNSYIHFHDLVGEALFLIISYWISKIQKFISPFLLFLSFHVDSFDANIQEDKIKNSSLDSQSKHPSSREKQEEGKLSREEAEVIMDKLGIVCNQDSKELLGYLSFNELSMLFEDEEPSLEEVKEAFHVFDHNREGFIDAKKLHRILCILGFKEGSKLEDCEKMIKRFDENGDGSIDFNEFVKFMEKSF